ncbi:MAG: hypothetical protein GY953_58395 [bacterium]|nr:hypothetical protein [bacterium]
MQALAIRRAQFFDRSGCSALHQALASYKDSTVRLELEAEITAEGIESFATSFKGSLEKANSVRSFLEPFFRTAKDVECSGAYHLVFLKPLSTAAAHAEAFTKALTKYGGAEAYVEAEAAAEKEG